MSDLRFASFPRSMVACCLALMLMLAACGGDDEDPATSAPAAADSTPTEEVVAQEATATFTPVPEPTATDVPEPTPTFTPFVPAPTVAVPRYQPPPPPPAPPTREPEPEPTPDTGEQSEPPANQEVPDSGDTSGLLLMSDLTELQDWDTEIGSGFTVEGGYYIVNFDSTGREYWDLTFAPEQFADIVASIDVLNVGESLASMACLAVRTSPEGWTYAYTLCLSGFGETFADFKYVDSEGQYLYEELVGFEVREGTLPVNEWNTLTIVVYGQELGFLINDELVGVAIHPAIEAGGVAFAVGNYDAAPAEWMFTNLQVWQVE
jgi:hypothetical protein